MGNNVAGEGNSQCKGSEEGGAWDDEGTVRRPVWEERVGE